MIKDKMDEIIAERRDKYIQDGYGIEKCWNGMVDLLSKNIQETIMYLEDCSKEDLYYVSEVFEDVAEKLQSKDYIECLRQLDKKFPELEMTKDIDLAEEYSQL